MEIPKHIAIIPDGNRRWAKERNMIVYEGHRRGGAVIEKLSKKAKQMGVKILTFWVFSTENWNRSELEVNALMKLFESTIQRNLKQALKDKTRIVHIGRKDRIPESLRKIIENAEEKTKDFDEYYFVIAIDYGGRDEIVRGIQSQKDSGSEIQNVDDFGMFLDTKDLPQPDPDLIIRTSGEERTSGFMIWQSIYAEYIFHKKYFPDFNDQDLEDCIKEYNNRQRRFGK